MRTTDRSRQRGVGGFFIAVVLLFAIIAVLAALYLARRSSDTQRDASLDARFARIDAAFTQYVAVNGRLPCPADPSSGDGRAVPDSPALACTFPSGGVPDGGIPWRSIGLAEGDALDPWGWKISYRVFTGAAGPLTQGQGASMVDCDITDPTPQGTNGGLCRSTHDTLRTEFLANKGLVVNDIASTTNTAAYVLVSHGPTGFGAYGASGVRKTAPANPAEVANFSGAGPYQVQATSGPGIDPGSATHFDDVLHYRDVAELITTAGLDAREWPDPVSSLLDAATLSAALGRTVSDGDLGTASVTVGNATISAFGGNLGFGSAAATGAGADGIGIAGGGSGAMTSDASGNVNGVLTFAYGSDMTRFAITLAGFGINGGYAETAAVGFFDASNNLIGIQYKSACNAGGGLASFSLTSTAFRTAVVLAQPARNAASQAAPSSFLVSDVNGCAASASTCTTSLTTAQNACP